MLASAGCRECRLSPMNERAHVRADGAYDFDVASEKGDAEDNAYNSYRNEVFRAENSYAPADLYQNAKYGDGSEYPIRNADGFEIVFFERLFLPGEQVVENLVMECWK